MKTNVLAESSLFASRSVCQVVYSWPQRSRYYHVNYGASYLSERALVLNLFIEIYDLLDSSLNARLRTIDVHSLPACSLASSH